MSRLPRIIIVVLVLISVFFSLHASSKPAYASILDNIVNTLKNIVSPNEPKETKDSLSIESKIYLAPKGDINNDGEIGSGDIVRFEFVLHNESDEEMSWMSLDTKIDPKLINFIHNAHGITGLDRDKETIKFSNIRIYPKQSLTISFDARINISTKKDLQISTEPELFDKEKKLIKKDEKKLVNAKSINASNNKSNLEFSKKPINFE